MNITYNNGLGEVKLFPQLTQLETGSMGFNLDASDSRICTAFFHAIWIPLISSSQFIYSGSKYQWLFKKGDNENIERQYMNNTELPCRSKSS